VYSFYISSFTAKRFSMKPKQSETVSTEKAKRGGLLGKLGLKKKSKKTEEEAVEEKPVEGAPLDEKASLEPEEKRDTKDDEAPVDPEPATEEAEEGDAREQPEEAAQETGMFCGFF
jgi:hypothetical protein